MPIIQASVTSLARSLFPQMLGGLLPHQIVSFFRIGEGGWRVSGVRVRRDDLVEKATFTDLDIILDAGRPGNGFGPKRYNVGESLGYFQKSFVPGDLTYEAPNTLRCSCYLDFPEYNTKQTPAPGGSTALIYDAGGPYIAPQLWEVGIYDAAGNLLAYGTMPQQDKNNTKPLENIVRISF